MELNPGVADAYRWLADQPPGAVIEFPVDAYVDPRHSCSTALAMHGSTIHWKPLEQGYSGFAPRVCFDSLLVFTGDLPKANGQTVGKVSYINVRHVGVLQDLGVRYIVLHRWGYKERDLRETAGGVSATSVSVALFAPSLAVTDHFWEPAVVVRNPKDGLGLLTIRRPLKLTTTWWDAAGHRVRRDELAVNLPAIVPPGDLFCTVRICSSASGVAAPSPPPSVRPAHLFPDKPGRYRVELVLTGNATLPETAGGGPPLAFGGANADTTTIASGDNLALFLDWETRLPVSEDLTLFAQSIGPDGEAWGQYDAPASRPGHDSRDRLPGERVGLPWSLPLQPDTPPGQHRLLVGMYRRIPTGVERAPLRYPDGELLEHWVGEVTVR